MPALGVVGGVDPDGVVVAHPRDEFLVLDGDDTVNRRNFRDQCYAVTNMTERIASEGAQQLVEDEQWIAFGVQGKFRRRFCFPSGGLR